MWVPVAVWQLCKLLYTCYLLTYLLTYLHPPSSRIRIVLLDVKGNVRNDSQFVIHGQCPAGSRTVCLTPNLLATIRTNVYTSHQCSFNFASRNAIVNRIRDIQARVFSTERIPDTFLQRKVTGHRKATVWCPSVCKSVYLSRFPQRQYGQLCSTWLTRGSNSGERGQRKFRPFRPKADILYLL